MNFKRRMKKNKRSTTKRSNKRLGADYQRLEPRQMLAVEVGVNFTGTIDQIESTAFKPNQSGAVGVSHIIEVVNDRVAIYDKSGTELSAQSLTDFWAAAGAVDAIDAMEPRVIFDADSGRFIASSIGGGTANTVYLAVSATGDPSGAWASAQFDTAASQFSGDDTLSVDAAGVYVTTTNLGGGVTSSIFSIPKEDMLEPIPDLINMTRFEGLDRSVYGTSIQVALDVSPAATRAISLGTFSSGTTIVRTDVIGSVGPAATLTTPIEITVPAYDTAPDARQPGGLDIEHTSPTFSGNVIRKDGFLWAVHTVEGSRTDNSAIRWYKIDEATNTVADMGTFENDVEDYFNPSIAVNDFGVISIGYSVSGLNKFPSAFAVMGFTENGLTSSQIVWQDPVELRAGLENYEKGTVGANDWSDYSSTQVDPVDPFAFYTFQEYATTDSRWAIRIAETGVFDLNPTIRGNDADNVIIVRASSVNSDWVEVEFDGQITDVFETRALNTLNINGLGGNDILVLDYSNGNPIPPTGVTLRGGDGFDIVQTIGDTAGHDYVIDGDGRGFIDDGSGRFRDIEQIDGSFFADTFTVLELTTELTIRGSLGDDLFTVVAPVTGTLNLYGEQGDDDYRLGLENLSRVNVFDSNGFENDIVTAIGTTGNDEITLNGSNITLNGVTETNFFYEGIETLAIDGLKGADKFYIQDTMQPLRIFGSEGRDEFYLSSDAPAMNGDTNSIRDIVEIDGGISQNRLFIGGAGNQSLDVRVGADTIRGMTEGDLVSYVATGGSFAQFNGNDGIVLTGSSASDTFTIVDMLRQNRTRIEAGDGNDFFDMAPTVPANFYLDGQGGSDTYDLPMMGSTSRIVTVGDTGNGDNDRIRTEFTDGDDFVRAEFGTISLNAERIITGFQTEVMVFDLGEGDDVLNLNRNILQFLSVDMGDGNDRVLVNGSRGIKTGQLFLGDGDDNVNMSVSSNQSMFSIFGSDGDDRLDVSENSFADTVFNGDDGSDLAQIQNIGRTNRFVAFRDNGFDGVDQLNITGVGTQDRYTVAPTVVQNRSEKVSYDSGIEFMVVDAAGGNDIVTVSGSVAGNARVLARGGNDLIFVEGTAMAKRLVVDGGTGNDTFDVTGTAADSKVAFYGQGGDDLFIVGSLPGQDDGNLNLIRGRVNLFAGSQISQDRLYVNDKAARGEFGYYVSNRAVGNLDGRGMRPNFGGISMSGQMEFVRVDGTDQANFFSVLPSQNTRVHIDGNLPEDVSTGDFLNLLGGGDGRSLAGGTPNGTWSFTNGHENVSYENIEFVFGSSAVGNPLATIASGSTGARARMAPGGNDDGFSLAGSMNIDGSDSSDYADPTRTNNNQTLDDLFANDGDLLGLDFV